MPLVHNKSYIRHHFITPINNIYTSHAFIKSNATSLDTLHLVPYLSNIHSEARSTQHNGNVQLPFATAGSESVDVPLAFVV